MSLDRILSRAALGQAAIADRVSSKVDAVLGRSGSGGRTLTVVGVFDASIWGSEAAEIAAIEAPKHPETGAPKWHPATADYRALAAKRRGAGRGRIPEITDALALVHFILSQPKGSIVRLNILTHGSEFEVGLSGEIEEYNVAFTAGLNLGVLHGLLRDEIIFNGKQVAWTEVEARFASGAVIAIYACSAAVSKSFLQEIAEFFSVPVMGFDRELIFTYPKSALSGGRIDRRRIQVDGQEDFMNLKFSVSVEPELKSVTF